MIKKNIIIDNLNITYYQSQDFNGQNSLIFLHGWKSQAQNFKNILDKCANYIALDLPGFGLSELPKRTWNLGDFSDFLKNFIEKLNINEPILIGHSFGGSIAIKYAAMGNGAKKIILIDSSGIRKKTIKKLIYLLLAKFFKYILILPPLNLYRRTIKKSFYKKIGSLDYFEAKEHKDIYKEIIKEDLTDQLNKITVSTDIIWGENDKDVPLNYGQVMNKHIRNSKFYIIKGTGHWPFIEREEEFNKIFFSLI
jgi:pimeloyl-ACP methyl ester carboxylesterase